MSNDLQVIAIVNHELPTGYAPDSTVLYAKGGGKIRPDQLTLQYRQTPDGGWRYEKVFVSGFQLIKGTGQPSKVRKQNAYYAGDLRPKWLQDKIEELTPQGIVALNLEATA